VGVVEREERWKILGKMGDVKWVEVAAGSGAVPWWVGVSGAFGAVVGGGRRGGGRGNTQNHINRSNSLKEKKKKKRKEESRLKF
jgi:hypothetical protein